MEKIEEIFENLCDDLGDFFVAVTIAYNILLTVFLWRLHVLNTELLYLYGSSEAIKILSHKSGKPILFFIIAVIFAILGIYLVWRIVSQFIHSSFERISSVIYCVVQIIIITILIIVLYDKIQIPILKAILFFLGLGSLFGLKAFST